MIIITRRRRRRRRMERSKLKRKSPRRARWPARSREIIRPNGSSELRDQRVGRDALSHHDARARDVEAGQHAIPRGDELRGDGDGDDEVLAETVERGSSGGEAAEVREGDEERDRAVKRVEEQTGDGAEDAGTGHAGGGELGEGRALHLEESHHEQRNGGRALANGGDLLGRNCFLAKEVVQTCNNATAYSNTMALRTRASLVPCAEPAIRVLANRVIDVAVKSAGTSLP